MTDYLELLLAAPEETQEEEPALELRAGEHGRAKKGQKNLPTQSKKTPGAAGTADIAAVGGAAGKAAGAETATAATNTTAFTAAAGTNAFTAAVGGKAGGAVSTDIVTVAAAATAARQYAWAVQKKLPLSSSLERAAGALAEVWTDQTQVDALSRIGGVPESGANWAEGGSGALSTRTAAAGEASAAALDRRLAQSMGTTTAAVRVVEMGPTAESGTGRISLEELDRRLERDARRYDGGLFLY